MAMLMALMTMAVLGILAGELIYQSGVYSSVVFRQRDQLRAALLARTGLRLAILQLKLTKKAKAKVKSMGLGDNNAVVDKIWQTPLVLPPPSIPGLSGIDEGALAALRKALGFDGSVSVTILGESGRSSLGTLVWPGETKGIQGVASGGVGLDGSNPYAQGTGQTAQQQAEQKKQQLEKNRKAFAELLEELFEQKRQNDDAFRQNYPSLRGETLTGHLVAWMDPGSRMDGDNRDKADYYSSLAPSYAPKNAPIASESEYHMIKGFDDEIARFFSENFTVMPSGSLDVNKASRFLIKAYIPELGEFELDEIEKRRTDESMGGAFKDAKDFWSFLEKLNSRLDEAKKRLEENGVKILEEETSYRVAITATSGMATKNWVAQVGPLPPKVEGGKPEAPASPQSPRTATATSTSTSTSTSTNTGTETGDDDSLNIVYLRSE